MELLMMSWGGNWKLVLFSSRRERLRQPAHTRTHTSSVALDETSGM